MLMILVAALHQLRSRVLHLLHSRGIVATRPATHTQPIGVLADLVRSKRDLVAENALPRQQLIVLRRHSRCPTLRRLDRLVTSKNPDVRRRCDGYLANLS
jgi:hypothetical protein